MLSACSRGPNSEGGRPHPPKSPEFDRDLFGQGQLERADWFHVFSDGGAVGLPSVRILARNDGLN